MGKLKIYTASSSPKGSKLKIYTAQPKSEEQERDTSKDIVFTPQESPKFEPKPINYGSSTNVKSKKNQTSTTQSSKKDTVKYQHIPFKQQEQFIPTQTSTQTMSNKRSEKFQPMQWQELSQFKSTWTPNLTPVKQSYLQYIRQNGNPIRFNPKTGALEDQVTGESGTILLPGIKITPKRYDAKNSTFNSNFSSLGLLQTLLGNETGRDVHGVLFAGNYTPIQRLEMLYNGLQSKLGLGVNEQTSQMTSSNDSIDIKKAIENEQFNNVDTTVIDPIFAQQDRFGDTIKIDNRFFMLPESRNLNGVKLGFTNRHGYKPFETVGGLIPTYKPIQSYEDGIKTGAFKEQDSEGNINHFLGYGPNGYPKIGPLSEFAPGDTLTQVFYSQLTNIPRDNNGNYLYGTGTKSSKKKSPYADIIQENGKSSRNRLLIMTDNKHNPNNMGFAVGGAYLVKTDNEFRLIRGSVTNVLQELEAIKKNHKGKPIYLYEVDNGSYNRGMIPFGNTYTPELLDAYYRQNTDNEPGGHFFYIKPEIVRVLDKKPDTNILKKMQSQ